MDGNGLLARAEQNRKAALSRLDPKRRDALGQFFTPARAAELIASMPRLPVDGAIRVLDPGAGSGMLSAALISRVLNERPDLAIHIIAVECDEPLLDSLSNTLRACRERSPEKVSYEVVNEDYIISSTGFEKMGRLDGFDLVVQNPPYGKLRSHSAARTAVRETGVDAPNLYAAFMVLAANSLKLGGQLVSITPRSFCNGPYFGNFRSHLLGQIALDRLHVFESRSTVFADTGVLQENVILSGTKYGARNKVTLSASDGHEDDAHHRSVKYSDVIHDDDPHQFIRIATNDADMETAERVLALPSTLQPLEITVSTGRVVDFRSKECLLWSNDSGARPLVYPANIRSGKVAWPCETQKAQWFRPLKEKDEKLLLPQGWYCVVKRFSAKEEKRRVVAAVWSPDEIPGNVAFENHLNVFHLKGSGLERDVAYGLSMWLNSSLVDKFFRTFSGHTQVNATDLRTLRFPDMKTLRDLGSLISDVLPAQEEIDSLVDNAINAASTAA